MDEKKQVSGRLHPAKEMADVESLSGEELYLFEKLNGELLDKALQRGGWQCVKWNWNRKKGRKGHGVGLVQSKVQQEIVENF